MQPGADSRLACLGMVLSTGAFAAPSQISLEEAFKAAINKSEVVQRSAEQLVPADARA